MIDPAGMRRVPYPDCQVGVSEAEGILRVTGTDLGAPRDLDLLDRRESQGKRHIDIYRFERSPTSVLPMTEPGPGSGGAQRQKSSTELTEIHWASVNSWDATGRLETNYTHFGKSSSGCCRCHTCWCQSVQFRCDREDCPESRSQNTSVRGHAER